jgi:hypothetical protein
MLQKLYAVICRCDRSDRLADMNALIAAIRLMARIQGELQPLSRRRALPPPEPPETPAQRRCRERIDEILREADERAAAHAKAKRAEPPVGTGDAPATGAMESRPVPAPMAAERPDTAPPAAAPGPLAPRRAPDPSDLGDDGDEEPAGPAAPWGGWLPIDPYRRTAYTGRFMGVG